MNKFLKLLLFVLIFSLKANLYAENYQKEKTINTEKQSKLNIVLPETIKICNVSERKETKNFFENNIPWITAFFVGVLSAIINFLIANQLRKSNEKNLKLQLDNSKEMSSIQFKATIATKNRQEWINDLRHTLSDLIALTTAMLLEMNIDAVDPKNIKDFMLKIYYSQSKINMLLNTSKPEQKDLIDKINELVLGCTTKHEKLDTKIVENKINNVIQSAQNLFELHWNKIKKLE